ncbi:hypothetical protein [Mesorhizobium sp.]|uniref:hypothetical protein n=1 Tax=Mesorhizobium sp. TaxID=1871066 RepID=UPI00122179B4|nr:hypothetical protein [Mesorhizobium sp.]TIM05504.1 MAG: hypothetical protein E5Y62_27320 [Mesorhizobium sp.]
MAGSIRLYTHASGVAVDAIVIDGGVVEALAITSPAASGRYAGPPIPMLKLRLPATNKSGFYQVRFVGTPSAKKPVRFAVTNA